MKHITECSCFDCDHTDQPCAEGCRKRFDDYQDKMDSIVLEAFNIKEQNNGKSFKRKKF